jgi:hypothetical protein
MKYSLRSLMIVAGEVGFSGAVLCCVIASVFVMVGVMIIRARPESILSWDQRTGRWIYERELRASGDEKRALAKAATFYRVFGACFVAMGLLQLVAWTCKAFLTYGK